ncbi:hypothetical protein DPX39_030037600 [Trypanosoma brucei equiperdum]|nr:hypothetical protein DPX39_030037600 [Trypanosoma brucei equiperdum]
MVAYAMHCLQIPVLSLTKGQKAKGNDDAEHWVSTILYKDLDGSHTDPLAAVNEFFTFPDKVGELLAVEGRDSQLTLQYCRELRSYLQRAWSAEVKLVGPNGCDMSEEGLDGTKCGETDNVEEQVEVESGIHAPLVKELLGNSQLESTHQNDHLLHGAMYALNRHENLPIIRYRLQRGVNIILCRPMSSSLEKLFNKFSRMRGGAEDVRRSFIDAVKSLLQFEGRWLDMPRRRVVLIREGVAHSWSAWLGNEVIHPLVDWIPVDVKAGNIADHCASLEASVKKAVRRLSR